MVDGTCGAADLVSRKRKCWAAVAANWRDGKSGEACREFGKSHSIVIVREGGRSSTQRLQ
jgi:hypothetical protein